MSWEKAQRTIRLKPYLIDPCRLRGIAAARKRLVYEGMPLPEKVLATARLRAEMSIPQWETYLGMSDKKIRRKCRKAAPVRFGTLLYISRRAVIAGAIIILIASFMTFTPVGRAWAFAAYNAISEVIDGILYIRSEERGDNAVSSTLSVAGINASVVQFDSLDDVLGRIEEPVFYLATNEAELTDIQLTTSQIYGDYLEISYVFKDKVQVIIKQDWGGYTEDSIILDSSKEYINVTLNNEIVVEGAYSADDEIFIGSTVIGDTIVHIVIDGAKENNDIEAYLCSLVMG